MLERDGPEYFSYRFVLVPVHKVSMNNTTKGTSLTHAKISICFWWVLYILWIESVAWKSQQRPTDLVKIDFDQLRIFLADFEATKSLSTARTNSPINNFLKAVRKFFRIRIIQPAG